MEVTAERLWSATYREGTNGGIYLEQSREDR